MTASDFSDQLESSGMTETAASSWLARGVVIAGMSGGSGKSVVSVGVTAALARRGRLVVPFKKGPDYIDAGWLQLAAGSPCYNLDPYLMSEEGILASFARHAAGAQRVVVEGNRGLHDGVTPLGGYSTAELAVTLGLPVILVVDCTKVTRTVAAMVLGCRDLDPAVTLGGVVLNRIGTSRHEETVRRAVEHYTNIPVLGAVPRQKRDVFPMRHLGVTPHQEAEGAGDTCALLADLAEKYIDLEAVEKIMAPAGRVAPASERRQRRRGGAPGVRIGILKDEAFQFYYPENLEALEEQGAVVVEIDALRAAELPDLDGLYIGGGFPETSARELAGNRSFRQSVRRAAAFGLPIYAECGGLIFLGESIELEGEVFPLAGVLPVRFGLQKRPQAHGYTVLRVEGENPFYRPGTVIKGHEFRYSTVQSWDGEAASGCALAMERGVGFIDGRDGLVAHNVLALYTHVHALGTPEWAPALVGRARKWKKERSGAGN